MSEPSASIRDPSSRLRVAALLVYDTRDQALPIGVRAVGQRATRLLFASDGFEILLQVSPVQSPGRVKVIGQVFSDGIPLSGAAVHLHGPLQITGWQTDEAGQFRLSEIPKGEYGLRIETSGHAIEVGSINLHEQRSRLHVGEAA